MEERQSRLSSMVWRRLELQDYIRNGMSDIERLTEDA